MRLLTFMAFGLARCGVAPAESIESHGYTQLGSLQYPQSLTLFADTSKAIARCAMLLSTFKGYVDGYRLAYRDRFAFATYPPYMQALNSWGQKTSGHNR
ncbi:hypothetical protein [Pseudomonas typographi]|uniref:Lipoprotein n=1 Tax=Pseudomonas typographi TaxID=2715964 RepID=A0ABR7Z0N2_9PSED|nr:hypothetical protein [Pseudomonas typographi]MBD1599044.1 hypothetical protein [Pseudomonas typographi]